MLAQSREGGSGGLGNTKVVNPLGDEGKRQSHRKDIGEGFSWDEGSRQGADGAGQGLLDSPL